jgi:hypothetical protein
MGCRLTDGIVGGTAKNISIRGWSTSSRW